MTHEQYIQYIGWACTLLGGFLCGVLTFWLLRPRRKRMPRCTCPAPHVIAESCPLHGIGPGGNRELAAWANEQARQFVEKPKPVPYASARGSKPPAPWDDLERRVTELEAELREDSRLATKCLIQNQCRLDEMDQRLTALENRRPEPAPEPLAPGVRVWKDASGWRWLEAGGRIWVSSPHLRQWHTHTGWESAHQLCQDAARFAASYSGFTELHGHERDEFVRDWMARGNV